jgi:hypothetical protein
VKVKIEIDGAAAETVVDAPSDAPQPSAPPDHVLARAAATGALNAGPAPTAPQSPGGLAPSASEPGIPPPAPAMTDQSAGAGPGVPPGEDVGVVEQT